MYDTVPYMKPSFINHMQQLNMLKLKAVESY